MSGSRRAGGRGRANGARALPAVLALALALPATAAAQFRDDFDGPALRGWTYFTGSGSAHMEFGVADGRGVIRVDSRGDRRNIWWALIKRPVSPFLDLHGVGNGRELRLEARVRSSHAPRRVNLHVNTQKTVDFHSHLMEYDLPDTLWHTISMTTRGFRTQPGDTVNAQLALMDWGRGEYRVELDYFAVDVVDAATAAPDLGEPLPYRPPVPAPASFHESLPATQDAVVDVLFPDVNLSGWYAADPGGHVPVLSVGSGEIVILRWDLRAYAGKRVRGSGVLELTTHSLQRPATDLEEFGWLRVAEITGGDPSWERATVTLAALGRGQGPDEIFNPQLIQDVEVAESRGAKTRVVISRPVLQRLLDGRSRGLVLRPQGLLNATFFSSAYGRAELAPRLYFNIELP